MEKNADLTGHFASNELGWSGARLKIGLGRFNREITLERVSESEVYARLVVPNQKRPKTLEAIQLTEC